MPGRHQLTPSKRPKLRWLAGGAGAAIVAAIFLAFFPASADASGTVVKAQLTLSGLATADNPLGGSQIGIHPGDSVEFTPSTAPTAGLDKLGLGGLVGGLLDSLTGFQVRADFSKLPGGHANTIIKTGSAPVTFRFDAKGTYSFTWTAEKVGLLGQVEQINLDANQLKQAGVALNASNQYVGKVVVATDPPKGGISVQLPGISAAPNVGGHQLPTVGVPGVNAPTIPVTVPNLPGLPKLPGLGGSSSAANPGAGNSTVGNELPVPARVVPSGDGNAVFGNVGGGYQSGVLPGLQNQAGGSGGGRVQLAPLAGKASSSPVVKQDSTGKNKTIDLAASKENSTGQFSVILAIIAVIALSVVAATYARLYLLRRGT